MDAAADGLASIIANMLMMMKVNAADDDGTALGAFKILEFPDGLSEVYLGCVGRVSRSFVSRVYKVPQKFIIYPQKGSIIPLPKKNYHHQPQPS